MVNACQKRKEFVTDGKFLSDISIGQGTYKYPESLNEATKYAPLHCLNFDRRPTMRSGRHTASASSVLEVHVTIQNITPDGSSFNSSASPSVAPSPPISKHHIATPLSLPTPSTSSLATLFQMPVPVLHGQKIFPPLSLVIALLASEHPGHCWNQLEEFLWEAGVYSSEHILLADLTVLALIGNMGA